jgi:hypothetical protein
LSGFLIFASCLSSVEDVECSGYPSAIKTNENVSQVKKLFLKNRRIIIHELADMSGISFQSLQSNWQDSLNALDGVFLLGNTPAHSTLSVHEFETKKKSECLYTPFLLTRFSTPYDFLLSSKTQDSIKGEEDLMIPP